MSWLTPYMGPDPALDGLAERIGALLVGRRTWTGDDPNRGTDKEGAFSGTWTGPQVVLTRHKPEGLPAEPGVTYSDDVLEAIELAKAGAGTASTSASWAPGRHGAAGRRVLSTRSWSRSHRSCWGTASGCSTSQGVAMYGWSG